MEKKYLPGDSQNSEAHSATGVLDFRMAEYRVFMIYKDSSSSNRILLPLVNDNLTMIAKKRNRS